MIDVIIPTMWFSKETTLKSISEYVSCDLISKVIIIDNNKNDRPKDDILSNKKIDIVCYNKNIFVNPAWNEGVSRSTADLIAIINDDIIVQSDVFKMVDEFDLGDNDIIGVNLQGRQNNYKIDDFIDTKEEIVKIKYDIKKPVGGQAWAFGICMFMKRSAYKPIPSLYKIWYGDDYLVQRASNVYAINSNKIKGKISETLVKFSDPSSYITKQIELDSKNFLRFGHFVQSDHWDLPKQFAKKGNVFEEEYLKAKTTPSDINENLHVLYELAKECESVVEMGVRTGVSTRAFLNTKTSLTSYDIVINQEIGNLFHAAKSAGKDVKYINADVLNVEIDEVDLLFIDTLHTYEQLRQELTKHGNKAKKYIVFHDTYTFGLQGELKNDRRGLLSAIIEFMIENPQWKFHIYKTNNNGLTVLKKVNTL